MSRGRLGEAYQQVEDLPGRSGHPETVIRNCIDPFGPCSVGHLKSIGLLACWEGNDAMCRGSHVIAGRLYFAL